MQDPGRETAARDRLGARAVRAGQLPIASLGTRDLKTFGELFRLGGEEFLYVRDGQMRMAT